MSSIDISGLTSVYSDYATKIRSLAKLPNILRMPPNRATTTACSVPIVTSPTATWNSEALARVVMLPAKLLKLTQRQASHTSSSVCFMLEVQANSAATSKAKPCTGLLSISSKRQEQWMHRLPNVLTAISLLTRNTSHQWRPSSSTTMPKGNPTPWVAGLVKPRLSEPESNWTKQ